MIRFATNPPRAPSPSPHLYPRARPTSNLLPRRNLLLPLLRRHYLNPFTLALILFWLLLILYHERWLWSSALSACQWENWEKWPADATPHRVVLVADPQLVDLHTYPRRGLSLIATIFYSDLYLSRAWSSLHSRLSPTDTYFLGDLFDGGREWSASATPGAKEREIKKDPHAEKDWGRLGMEYWLSEFARFVRLFPTPPGVRVKTGVPGNHDFGFGGGVKESARGRFSAFFGEANERWSVGNHTWVSVDSVSLSNDNDPAVYGPAKEFLDGLANPMETGKWQHRTLKASDPAALRGTVEVVRQPTVLLTHVPLFREKGTDCGPKREKGTAIPIWQGYQYQNVLAPELSVELLEKTGARYVFSGDDHDACEVTHMYGPMGRVREWTVKSLSANMGVRTPGFEMVSLWNPGTGAAPTGTTGGEVGAKVLGETLQSQLCLLPDQIGVFLSYATWGGVSLIAVILRVWFGGDGGKWWGGNGGRRKGWGGDTLLPTTTAREDGEGKYWKPVRGQARGLVEVVRQVATEFSRVAAVVVMVYVVLLWMW